MLEVGKKYYWNSNSPVCECIFKGKEVAVMRYPDEREQAVSISNSHYWTEHVEPRREFFNAFKMGDNTEFTGPYRSRLGSDQFTVSSGYFRYGVLELIHHSDTKVESIFHLVTKK